MRTRASTASSLSVMRPTLYQFTPKCAKDIIEAIRGGHFNQVRFLIELGYDVNVRDERGRTALMLCAKIGEERWAFGLAQTLVEKQAELDAVDDQGMTALHYACANQRELLVGLLLSAVDYDVNEQDVFGNTPLLYAVIRGNVSITRTMVSHLTRFRYSIDLANRAGFTPLLQAAKRGHEEIVNLLIDAGADISVRDREFHRSYHQWLDLARTIRAEKEQEALAKAQRRAMRFDHPSYYQKDWRAARRNAGNKAQERDAEIVATDKPFSKAIADSESFSVACDYDLRNDSVYVFQKTSTDLFHESLVHSRSSLGRSRSVTYSHTPVTPIDCSTSSMSFATLSQSQSQSQSQDSARTWRFEMPSIYRDLEQRCSSAYRPTVKVDAALLGFFTDDADSERATADGKKAPQKGARQSLARASSTKETAKDAKKPPRKPAANNESPKLKK